jgi:hypothetical protein
VLCEAGGLKFVCVEIPSSLMLLFLRVLIVFRNRGASSMMIRTSTAAVTNHFRQKKDNENEHHNRKNIFHFNVSNGYKILRKYAGMLKCRGEGLVNSR